MKTLSSHNATDKQIRKQTRKQIRLVVRDQVSSHVYNQALNQRSDQDHRVWGIQIKDQVHSKVIAWKK